MRALQQLFIWNYPDINLKVLRIFPKKRPFILTIFEIKHFIDAYEHQ
jgi:hypothetical protein